MYTLCIEYASGSQTTTRQDSSSIPGELMNPERIGNPIWEIWVMDEAGNTVDHWCREEDEYDDEDDGQPTEYEEWQDYMGGDDWDHGQYDDAY